MNDILYQTSPIWKRIAKQTNDAVTDYVILFAYVVKRNDRPRDYSQLLTEGIHFFKLNEKGKAVEKIIEETKLKDCQIDWYSINANKIGKEESCNNLSLIVYAHWDTPYSIDEAQKKMYEEVDDCLIKPIGELLKGYHAILTPSAYDHGQVISSWTQRDELLVGDTTYNFKRGHF